MKNLKKILFTTALFLIFSLNSRLFALDYTDLSTILTDFGFWESSKNAGLTSYRSLLIPIGGRPESLGTAYTGLCDDAAYISYNPAASSIMKETQASVYHNNWIADSHYDNIIYTTRVGDFGFGLQGGSFYLPFSEYNLFGERVNSTYYSESSFAANFSYNFLAGYDFKGISLGSTVRGIYREMPAYTDNNTDAIIPFSGLAQSGFGIMADFGIMMQFNFLKYFASRDPNVKIGFAAQNVGIGITGLGSKNGVKIDDPLPTYFAAGFSCQFLPIITVTLDIKQPVNLLAPGKYENFSTSAGVIFGFNKYVNLLAGFELKGGNPKISAGGEFQLSYTRVNFNYTLDLASSINPVNRISISAKVMLGDRGRAERQKRIDALYSEGLTYYANSDWDNAINSWEKVLIYNKRYDPAILGIESAKAQRDMYDKVRESMFFDE